jgi:hypothetical protein
MEKRAVCDATEVLTNLRVNLDAGAEQPRPPSIAYFAGHVKAVTRQWGEGRQSDTLVKFATYI